MIIVTNNFITGNVGKNEPEYQPMKPWCHESGALRWVVDDVSPEVTIEGYNVRLRTQPELEADPLYQAWQAEQAAEGAKTQAKTAFGTMPAWMLTGGLTQVKAYIEANVTDLASAKDVLKQVARVLVLMRDYLRIKG